jgi:hypothetical protein
MCQKMYTEEKKKERCPSLLCVVNDAMHLFTLFEGLFMSFQSVPTRETFVAPSASVGFSISVDIVMSLEI